MLATVMQTTNATNLILAVKINYFQSIFNSLIFKFTDSEKNDHLFSSQGRKAIIALIQT